MRNADMPARPAGSVRKKRPAHDPGGDWVETDRVQPAHAGLTKLEEISSRIMASFASDPDITGPEDKIADVAVDWAEALLAAIERRKSP